MSKSSELDSEPLDRAPTLSSPVRVDEPDPRQSLQHVLAAATDSTTKSSTRAARLERERSRRDSSSSKPTVWIQEAVKDYLEDESSVRNDSYSRAADVNPSHTMTVAHTRRNANGTIGSVYSGNKIRHLKKEDGIPLWRKDIQYAFLRAVFEDTTPVFTKFADKKRGHTFADIYIDAMARSSKTSKILKEKLLAEREAALNMAMICLLVNVGRMNTTLNFFPEMRAQLRTYHSIPCLQAHQDPNAYKQLQDAPRLKSILKGACEDPEQPTTVEKIEAAPIPRTNPVNLIFVLSQYAPKVSETHFFQPRDFFDLVIRSTLSSRSRAKAFLWLIWWYLESDFSAHDAEHNPFGPGLPGDVADSMPVKVPAFDHLTEEQANAENIDTSEEKAYGEMKRLERKRILEEDETVGPPMKKTAPRHSEAIEERAAASPIQVDRTRSPSPAAPVLWLPKPTGRSGESRKLTGFRTENSGTGTRQDFEKQQPMTRLILKTGKQESSPIPPGAGHPVIQSSSTSTSHPRRSRPETSHQKAVNHNRKMRIESILHKKLVKLHTDVRRKKRRQTSTSVYTAMSRIIDLPDDYDSESEGAWGPGGLVPNPGEENDFAGEALRHKKVIDRAQRRLARADRGDRPQHGGHGSPGRKRRPDIRSKGGLLALGLSRENSKGGEARGIRHAGRNEDHNGEEETLDDLDLDLIGEGRGEDQGEDESADDSGMDETEDGDDNTEDGTMDER
ncbi:hypothetical protein MMC26_001429 [Xylographa opegraphella]|nr:hypothetical protein [Xylographa opegraphella]